MASTLAPVKLRDEALFAVVTPIPESRFYRFTECVTSVVLLAAAAPIIAGSAALIVIQSRRSPFVAHRRVGYLGRELWVWKIRTMWQREELPDEAERGWVQRINREPNGDIKPQQDARVVSRFAAWCRRHSIDELPQIAQVVIGEMSLIGPRPVTAGEFMRHYWPHASMVVSRRPGLTGLWQINGRSSLSYAQRVTLDIEMVQTGGWRQAWSILWRTLPAVVTGKNAW